MRNALFWDIMHRGVVVSYRRFGTTYQVPFLTPEEGPMLSRNFRKRLPLLAA